MRELALDVEPPTEPREVFRMREVATREPAVNRRQKADREQPDEKFKEVMALRVQRCKFAVSNSKLPRDGKHADEGRACGLVLSVDLGQYLEGLARDGEDADDLPRLQASVGSGQNRRFGQLQPPGGPFGGGVEPSCVVVR